MLSNKMWNRIKVFSVIISAFTIGFLLTNVCSAVEGSDKTAKKSKNNFLLDNPLGEQQIDNPCTSKKTCTECIRADANCAWCSGGQYNKDVGVTDIRQEATHSRCDLKSNIAQTACDKDRTEFATVKMTKLIDKHLSNKIVQGEDKDIVQIKPQRIHLHIGPNSPYDLEVEYRQAVDYPVDLYFLMDVSLSMEDDKRNLAALSRKLAEEMDKITKDFRLGFGTFIDKPAIPFAEFGEAEKATFCTKEKCGDIPYSFRHLVKMTRDLDHFTKTVLDAKNIGNRDAPEGGSDAIIQAIECKDQIGWRNTSRKIILFVTDAGFHYAGDGKLVGIVKPNDGKCHLDANNYYTESLSQDYPSIHQIDKKVRDNKVTIIFAVTLDQKQIYEKLSKEIEGSSTGQLLKDSSNIVDLVRDEYKKISSSIELKNSATKNVMISYYSRCLDNNGEEKQTQICKGLKVGQDVKFRVRLEVLSCPKDPKDWNQIITISPVGIAESLIIELEMQCECECEKPENEERDSPRCSNGNGTYECGICSCNPGRFGRLCQCDAKTSNSKSDSDLSKCRVNNESRVCSDHGECKCGVCQCFPIENSEMRYEGTYCECNNFDCDRPNGLLCSGHGNCMCSKCKCFTGWKGPSCNCMESTEPCKSPKNGKICNGKGECDCGRCICIETEETRYGGTYCEDCLTCLGDKCDQFKDCVECRIFKSGKLADSSDCGSDCNTTNIIEVNKAEANGNTEQLCTGRDVNDCRFFFVYTRDENGREKILAQKTLECPKPLNVLLLTGGIVGGILFVGLALLLIWKLLTTIHDRREYAKFLNESKLANWETGDNPLYKPSTSTFSNPAFGTK